MGDNGDSWGRRPQTPARGFHPLTPEFIRLFLHYLNIVKLKHGVSTF